MTFLLKLKHYSNDHHLIRFVKFALVGASGVGVDEGVAAFLLYIVKLSPFELVSTLSAGVAIFTNFVLNDLFTFRDRRSQGMQGWLKRLGLFYLICLAGVGIKVLIVYLANSKLGLPELVANLFGIAVATFWNYFINKRITWRFTRRENIAN
ncbi:MAG: GtrA family protein [Dehalococcoidales bacterium]|nr:GtrA family protein [Dehalococcoidales bacterium]